MAEIFKKVNYYYIDENEDFSQLIKEKIEGLEYLDHEIYDAIFKGKKKVLKVEYIKG